MPKLIRFFFSVLARSSRRRALFLTLSLGGIALWFTMPPEKNHSVGQSLSGISLVAPAAAQTAGLSLEEVTRMHDAARDGDAALADTLVEHLEAALAQGGGGNDRSVLLAYLGSATAIQARDGGNPMRRLSQTNRALRYLDEARDLSPMDFTVLQITAGVQSRLPGLFGRCERAIEDMMTLHQIFITSPHREYARAMEPIYAALAELAPGRGDWVAMAAEAAVISQAR
jgi:hypothetical protein